MRGRGWFALYSEGTPLQLEKWRERQMKIRDVIQVKMCEGCEECGEVKKEVSA